MKAPFTCCGHWNHERRIVQGIVFCVCVDCAHYWTEWSLEMPL